MSQVVEMLSKNVKLNEKQLTAPGLFQDSDRLSGAATSSKKSSNDSGNQTSSAPITITQVRPRWYDVLFYLLELCLFNPTTNVSS